MPTSDQKAASVLRDDLRDLVKALTDCDRSKHSILLDILKIEEDVRNNLNRKKDFDHTSSTEQVDRLIDEINILDYETSKLRDEFCRITGIEYSSFNDFISKRNEFEELSTLKKDILAVLKDISGIKQHNIDEMNSQSSNLQKQARELFQIQSLGLNYEAKAPQSS